MGAVTVGTAELGVSLIGETVERPSDRSILDHDRFAHWSILAARLSLFLLLALLGASALIPLKLPDSASSSFAPANSPSLGDISHGEDIALYEAAIRRIEAGEGYYDFIVAEHRARDYPVRPGFAVRLPTLAYINAALDKGHLALPVSFAVIVATVLAWWHRFGAEPGGGDCRRLATALVFLGCALGMSPHYFSLHEVWAGVLLALSFGWHRTATADQPGRWHAALLCAALALFIREQALPFVLLMGALAAWRKVWLEAWAWALLVVVFLGILCLHLHLVSLHVTASDPRGPSWLAFRGLSGWIGNITSSSGLRLLPHWLAGPLVILTTLGWASWRTSAGLFGFLISVGYGLLFMIVGRWDNFYWGALVVPMLAAGLSFAPRAFVSLVRAARLH